MNTKAETTAARGPNGGPGELSPPKNQSFSLELHGLPAAPGLVIGKAFVLPAAQALPEDAQTIPLKLVVAEKARLANACGSILEETTSEFALSIGSKTIVAEVQKNALALISPPYFFSAVSAVKSSLAAIIEQSPNHIKPDLLAIQEKLIAAIHGGASKPKIIPPDSVIISEELSAVTLGALAPQDSIIGLVTHRGGIRDHAAIVARDRGWPATFRVQGKIQSVATGDTVAVDGTTGRVWVNPTPEILRDLLELQKGRLLENELRPVASRIVHTRDGRKVFLAASVDSLEGLSQLTEAFPELKDRRIGLFRSEFELLKVRQGQKRLIDDEDAQVELYKRVLEVSGGRRVTIRTVDWSPGDKTESPVPTKNPALGHRGVRFSLKHPDQFRIQLRALLRASSEGEISIMFPMVHDAEQVQELMLQVEIAEAELAKKGIFIETSRQPTIGVMVEVPSAVREIEKISNRVDFVSIGSSDLTQYTLAFERDPSADTDATDEQTFAPHHPSVLAKIADVIQCAQKKKLQVSVCGEMASDSAYVPLLLGAGLQIFSVAPRGARSVYDTIESLNYSECRALLDTVLSSDGPIASLRLLESFNKKQREVRRVSDLSD